jgi:hypothetical protein
MPPFRQIASGVGLLFLSSVKWYSILFICQWVWSSRASQEFVNTTTEMPPSYFPPARSIMLMDHQTLAATDQHELLLDYSIYFGGNMGIATPLLQLWEYGFTISFTIDEIGTNDLMRIMRAHFQNPRQSSRKRYRICPYSLSVMRPEAGLITGIGRAVAMPYGGFTTNQPAYNTYIAISHNNQMWWADLASAHE